MASEDLLAKLRVLHNYVERELQGVVAAVSDLGVEERPTRKLHAILTQAWERIQAALARQRMLLWKFKPTENNNPAAGHASSPGGDRTHQLRKSRKNGVEELAVGSIRAPRDAGDGIHIIGSTGARKPGPRQRWPQSSNNNDCDEAATAIGELEWKRDTLVRMKCLLLRRAGDHTAGEADRAALKRDIVKITQALEQVQREIDDVQHKTRTCAAAPTRSVDTPEEGYGFEKIAGAMSVSRRDESPRESTTGRCSSVARGEQQERRVATKNACFSQPVRPADLQFPDGLDLLLSRIAEGAQPQTQPAASRPLPSSKLSSVSTSTRRSDQNTKISLPKADPPNSVPGNGEGGEAVQTKAAPALSSLDGMMNDRARKGCGTSIDDTGKPQRKVRDDRVLRKTSNAAAGKVATPSILGRTSPMVTFGGQAKETVRKGPTGSSDKENQPRMSN
eukprot:g11925.t1